MTEVPVTDWANYEGDLPERYPHRRPRKSGRGTEPIAGPDRAAYIREKRRRLKARSPTLTVTKVEPSNQPSLNKLTFENGLKAGHPKSKNAKIGDKFVVSSQDGRFAHIMDAEEGNAPIQDPMEFGEMANWTPLDGSEGLKRKRAEAIQVENVMAGEDTQMIYVSTYEAAVEEAERFIRHYFPADYTYSYHIHETDQPNRWEMVYGWVPQGEEAFLHDVVKASESPSVTTPVKGSGTWSPAKGGSATISNNSGASSKIGTDTPSATIPVNYPKHLQPDWQKTPASHKKMAKEMKQALETEDPAARHAAIFAMQDKYGDYWNQQGFNDAFKKEMEGSEPSWVKPVATALGFALGFFGIHELKKVL